MLFDATVSWLLDVYFTTIIFKSKPHVQDSMALEMIIVVKGMIEQQSLCHRHFREGFAGP